MSQSIAVDPLSQAIAPPADETSEERRVREKEEEEARRRSSQIDEEIKAEKSAMRKKRQIKILVLGQSESGKSTTIKNFQLRYARDSWLEERASWRAVIYLNLVRSVNTILDLITDEISKSSPTSSRAYSPTLPGTSDISEKPLDLSDPQKLLKLRLGPLQYIQKDLETILGSSSSEPVDLSTPDVITRPPAFLDHEDTPESLPSAEFSIRSDCGWKSVLKKVGLLKSHSERHPGEADRSRALKRVEEVSEVICSCKDDIRALWADPVFRDLLQQRNLALEDSSGFFLNDVDRIADPKYEPSDSDVLRARLRTIGVQEYRFVLNRDFDTDREWVMYDVAGIRTSRSAWMPFFDDANAIIFLAPISPINEVLAEDHRVNRIADSLLLWQAICSSKLLVNVQLILFLNKSDLLAKKLKNNRVLIKDYIPEYKERDNDIKTALNYFHKSFKAIMMTHRPNEKFFAHVTSVVDTKATAATLLQVKEKILTDLLSDAGFV